MGLIPESDVQPRSRGTSPGASRLGARLVNRFSRWWMFWKVFRPNHPQLKYWGRSAQWRLGNDYESRASPFSNFVHGRNTAKQFEKNWTVQSATRRACFVGYFYRTPTYSGRTTTGGRKQVGGSAALSPVVDNCRSGRPREISSGLNILSWNANNQDQERVAVTLYVQKEDKLIN